MRLAAALLLALVASSAEAGPVTRDVLQARLERAIRARMPWAEDAVRYEAWRLPAPPALPEGATRTLVRFLPDEDWLGRVTAELEFVDPARPEAGSIRRSASVELRARVPVVVTRQRLARGARLDAELATMGPLVAYDGDGNPIEIQIGNTSTITANVTGLELLFGSSDGDTLPDGGHVSLFDVVQDLRDALQTGGTPANVLPDLDAALDQVLQLRGRTGARLNRLEIVESQNRDLEITLTGQRSRIEDLDFVSAISELSARETTFQASLQVSARILQPSILDFLR